jgi:hypothetical protein
MSIVSTTPQDFNYLIPLGATALDAAGTKEVQLEVTSRIIASVQSHPPRTQAQPTQTLKASFEVVSYDTPTVEWVEDESARSQIEALLKPGEVVVTDRHGIDNVRIALPSSAGATSLPLAFWVSLRANGKETACGPFILAGAGSSGPYVHGAIAAGSLPDQVEVIFRSDPRVAESTDDITRIWKGELRFPNVTVRRDVAQSRPAPATPPSRR